jgi:hypothetical protein
LLGEEDEVLGDGTEREHWDEGQHADEQHHADEPAGTENLPV